MDYTSNIGTVSSLIGHTANLFGNYMIIAFGKHLFIFHNKEFIIELSTIKRQVPKRRGEMNAASDNSGKNLYFDELILMLSNYRSQLVIYLRDLGTSLSAN